MQYEPIAKTKIHTYGNIEDIKYVRTYDGDTSFFDIIDTHPVFGLEIGVRVLGVDTPEIRRSKTDCEKSLAYEARDFVETLLANSTSINLQDVDRDKYFRVLANISYDEQDLSYALLDNHLAVPYDGGTKETIDWCEQQKLFHQTEWYMSTHGNTNAGDL